MVTAAVLGWADSVNNRIISMILVGEVQPAISNDYTDELIRTMSKPYVEAHTSIGRAVEVCVNVVFMGKHFHPRRYDWPIISDRDDWWVVDLAFDAGVNRIVTWNIDHLAPARALGFDVITPPELLSTLRA